MLTRSVCLSFCTCRTTRQLLNTTNWSKGYATMADFRQLAKDNPLKPKPVAIPQFDPLSEIDTQNPKPKQWEARKTIKKPVTTVRKDVQPAITPPAESDDVDSYKSKY